MTGLLLGRRVPSPRAIPIVGIALPAVAVAVFAVGVLLIVSIAGSTLNYDYRAYEGAALRLLDGRPLYDPAVNIAGGFAVYLYPPPFAFAMVPFAALGSIGATLWLGFLVAAFLAGLALLPVRPTVRWIVLLLAGMNWPFLYSIKLGQVGPLLFLFFAAGWRWMDRPMPLGASLAAGTLVKLQPALLLGWAAITGRWRAFFVGVGLAGLLTLLSAAIVGPSVVGDYIGLLTRVGGSVTAENNVAPGAIAYRLGWGSAAGSTVELATFVIAFAAVVVAWLRVDAETSYVATVVASQLLSPLLWEHYAMLLLLPVALLLQRGRVWALLIPLLGWLPAELDPLIFAVVFVAVVAAGAPHAVAPRPSLARLRS